MRLIGVAELLGGLGLILPAATGIAPVLTPIGRDGHSVGRRCDTILDRAAPRGLPGGES